MISSAIAEEHTKVDVAPDPDASQNAKDGADLFSLVQAHIRSTNAAVTPPVVATTKPPKPPAVTLQSILKRAATSGSK